jgi:HD-GYP domain-containing protein (c-di-GMP phosphodiesterase class II)
MSDARNPYELAHVPIVFLRVLKNIQVYPKEHPLISQGLDQFMDFIQEHEGLSLEVNKGYLYINTDRIEITAANYVFIRLTIQTFNVMELGELEFLTGLVEREHLYRFFSSMAEAKSYNGLLASLEKKGVVGIITRPSAEDSEDGVRDRAKKLYFHTIKVIKSFFEGKKREVSLIKMKAAASYLADLLRHSEEALMGLTVIKNYDDYTYNHCLNVAILSLALAMRTGMERRLLVSLGTGALVHDIGKVKIPIEIISKPDKLADEEWMMVKRHPIEGLSMVLGQWGISRDIAQILPAIVEHHLGMNYFGYPEWLRKKETSILTGIIHITDFYDAVTTPRVYNKKPMAPVEAMQYLLDNSVMRFNPVLVKLFLNVMGFYPVGSVVKLSTGEWAMVVEKPAHSSHLDRPVVVVVADKNGDPLLPRKVSLEDGEVRVVGVSSQSPWNVGLDPTELALYSFEEQ